MIAGTTREMHKHPCADRLEELLAKASALSMVVHGVGGQGFHSLSVTHQQNVLWALADMVREIEDLTRAIVWNEGSVE